MQKAQWDTKKCVINLLESVRDENERVSCGFKSRHVTHREIQGIQDWFDHAVP
jgi:hypothetical protein